MAITIGEYFRELGSIKASEDLVAHAQELLLRVNALLAELGVTKQVTSGWRSISHNVAIGGSPKSAHCEAKAIDLEDANGRLKDACKANNNELLVKYNLYMEDPSAATTWCHLTTRAPKSGNRVFMP